VKGEPAGQRVVRAGDSNPTSEETGTLHDAHGGLWVRCAVMLEPCWVSAAVSWRQVLVLYGVRLGSVSRPTKATAATALPSGGRNSSKRARRGSWLPVRPLAHTLAEYS
jgi:hypothetical protein